MAINNELAAIVTYIERERGVEREDVLTSIEEAIKKAAEHNPDVTKDLRVVINRRDLSLHVYDTAVVSNDQKGAGFISLARARRIKPDAELGEKIEIEMPAARLGRIAAQTTRQVVMGKIREIEQTNVYTEFKNRIGEIVSGTVSAVNRRDLYVLVGKTEMLLPGKERIPTEEFSVGDSIRAIVHSVKPMKSDAKGPSVTLSRASAEFVRTLFRLEVGEISDGVVEIMGIARDPGYRTKLAVRTLDEKVDPVGACVGLKGARVRNIVRELNGDNTVHVTVAPDQYSLAIGKRGQNVRLTSKLTGWHVDVTKAIALASFEDQKAEAIKTLADMFSVSTAIATKLADAGFLTVEGIVESDEEGFIAATGLDEVTAKGLYAAAQAVAELTGVGSFAPAEEEE